MRTRWIVLLIPVVVLAAVPAAAQNGALTGVVQRSDGSPIGGVSVVLNELARTQVTNNDGRYTFGNLPPADYSLTFTLAGNSRTESAEVGPGERARLDLTVDWEVGFAETITVLGASRRRERVVDAPAAVTVISEVEIERQASHGQLPRLLEFTPGAEVTQSGLYDFNFNTRGFNSSLNRRILVLIDGRDPSVPFLGAQEWAAIGFPLDDLANVELVRGPGSALYGADAFNGVLNMVTKGPRYSEGGFVRVAGGELSTQRIDFRHATELGAGWYFKVIGGYQESDDFTRSRNQRVEYAPCAPGQTTGCLQLEPIALVLNEDEIGFGGVRFDKYFGEGGQVLTLEGGSATVEGPAFQTGIGRVQLTDVDRPWARVNFNTTHFNVFGHLTTRDADDQIALRSGAPLFLDTERVSLEVQGNTGFAGGKGFLVGGVSYVEEDIDSANKQGVQTLMFQKRDEDFQGVFGQVEYSFTPKLKGVIAARLDDSSLHDSEFSPRASLVYGVNPNHSLRATYNEAFQTPNYSEFFLQVPVAPPVNLGVLEFLFCAPFGVSCGFDQPVPILAVGNPGLEVEEIETIELGYTGIIGRRLYLTLDLYQTDIESFITDLIFRLNSTLGNINPNFGPYQAPSALPPPIRALLEATIRGLPVVGPFSSNNPDGAPVFALLSYVNFGKVESDGFELGLNYQVADNWRLDFSYSYLDFDVQQELPEDPVIANSADNKFSLGIAYVGPRFDGALNYRYVDDFEWNAGVFRGAVPSYDVMSLTLNYRLANRWRVGVDISNLLDDEHYQSFGGDILERRALGHVTFSW